MFTQSRMQGLVLEDAHSAEYIKEQMLFYVVSSTVTTLTLFMLVSWLSCWIGMRMKTQARAIFTTVALIVAWSFLPMLILDPMFGSYAPQPRVEYRAMQMLTPASFIMWVGYHQPVFNPWNALLFNTILYGVIAVILRQHCIKGAEGLLGRRDQFSIRKELQGLFRRRPKVASE
jgi:hypothetical protein